MRWGIVLVVLVLAGCAGDQADVVEDRSELWIDSIEERNESERSYALTVCSSDPLFQGAFIPFSVEVGSRSMIIDDAPHMQVSEECIEVHYEIERGFQEELLSHRQVAFELDPEGFIERNDTRSRIVYEPERICVDSDGDNPFLSGFVSAYIDGEAIFVLDTCSNETATEYVCDGSGKVEIVRYECADGCAGGSCRCLNSETCLFDGSAVRI